MCEKLENGQKFGFRKVRMSIFQRLLKLEKYSTSSEKIFFDSLLWMISI